MKIPSYDDLTPGISDVHPRDTFDQVTRLVPCNEPVVSMPPVARGTSHLAHGLSDVARRPSHPARGDSPVARGPSDVAHQHLAPRTSHVARLLFACLRARTAATPGALLALARDFSPRIERHGDACVVLDVGGLGQLLGDAHGIAGELQRTARDRGLKLRIAVAPTHTAAQLLTLGPPMGEDARVVTGDVAEALAPVAVATLQQFVGAPSRTFDALKRWGVRSVGEFAALPSDELASRFGPEGLAIQRLARGIDSRPLIPDPGMPRYIASMELEWPIEELEPLSFVLARLLDPLSLALERAGKAGAAIRLDLRLVDKTMHSRVLQLPAPMRETRVLRTLLSLDLESHPPSAGIDVVTIEIDPAPARIVQFSLLERAIPSPENLATLTARLNALVGEAGCGSPVLLDSHRPDAFEMKRFMVPGFRGAEVPRFQESVESNVGNLDLRNPGTVEPWTLGSLCLRRFRPPVAVRVAMERGHPRHVAIDRRGMPGGSVEQYAGPWRSSGAWWDASGSHWDRDEWDVALSDGALCRLYRDRDTERWFMDGVVD